MDNDKEKPNIEEIENFSKEDIKEIFECIREKKEKTITEIIIKYSKEDEFTICLHAAKNKISQKLIFYLNPVIVLIDKNENQIYTIKQCKGILKKYNLKDYSIIVNGQAIKNKQLDFNKIKNIKISKLESIDENKKIEEYIVRAKTSLPSEISRIEIKKKFLSSYFDEICISPDKNEQTIILILEQHRIELIKKIIEFLDSKNTFYLIMGTDGIGKTVTLLYYTSSFYDKYKNLYLNLKLFLKHQKEETELKEIFLEELKRLFLTNDNSEENITDTIDEYKSLVKEINKSKINSKGMQYFWDLLNIFIEQYDKHIEGNILIVLDQYKNEKIDEKFKNLNNLCKLICSNELTNKYKLMILISINNYDTKQIFVENLGLVSFIPISIGNILPYPNYSSNIQKNDEIKYFIEQEPKDNQENYEFSDIENYLKEKKKEINENFKNLKSIDSYPNNIYSDLYLNSEYLTITKKEYLNEVIDCRMLIKNEMNENYINCIEVFGFSLKYYILLLYEINNTDKFENEDDDDFAKKVVHSFYAKIYNKIVQNLNIFYKSIYKNNEPTLINKNIQNLELLDNSIYEEKIYILEDLKNVLASFPVKYLNIYMVGVDSPSIPLDKLNISQFGFIFDYCNNFVRETIHKYYLQQSLFVYRAENLGGSGFGALFEESVNNKLKSLFNINAINRKVFSIVGTGSKDYVEKIRKREDLEFYKFYGIKKFKGIIIDGIDKEKVTKDDCDFLNNDIILSQLSQCGRSFDIAILKKLPINQNGKTHNLILFQDTKDKVQKLKSKNIYIKDGKKSKKFLEKTYVGLKINKIYLIFIIPKNFYISETVKKLKDYNIYYLLFNTNSNNFCKDNLEDITDFCIPEADITIKDKDYRLMSALIDIKKSKFILKESSRNYLGKKRLAEKKFFTLYNKICQDNAFNCIIYIMPIDLKNNILKELKKEKYFPENISINFIPSTNCSASEIENIFKHEKNLFIFSYKDTIYFFHHNYYIINDDYSLIKTELILPKNSIKYSKKNVTIKKFLDIKKYPLFCFCYNIIINHNFS